MNRFIPLLAFFLFTSGLAAKGGGKGGGGGSTFTVSTGLVSYLITQTTANANVYVSSTAGVKENGVCCSLNQNPTTADMKYATTSVSGEVYVTGLSAGTTYHIRAYATKKTGTTYGNEIVFRTLDTPLFGTVTDVDQNIYTTVTIGSQTWMMENLKTTRYRDGWPIAHVIDNADWINPSIVVNGAYCEYNNDQSIADVYGRLYNWYAVTNSHNIAPAGWHVATKADWDVLEAYLGGIPGSSPGYVNGVAIPMKEAGYAHWPSGNRLGTNASSFTALPAGTRNGGGGGYANLGELAVFWSSSSYPGGYPYNRSLHYTYDDAFIWPAGYGSNYPLPFLGASVRCVKDNQSKTSGMGLGDPSSVPTGYVLHQNYPNPFNPTTMISYSIPEDGVVTLRVFDALGRMVRELVNGMDRAGRHQLQFSAGTLPSGSYFCRLEVAGVTQTRVMNIMK